MPERAAVLEQKVAQLSLQLKAQTREVELWRKIDEAKQEEMRILEQLQTEDEARDGLVAQLCSAEAPDPRIVMPHTLIGQKCTVHTSHILAAQLPSRRMGLRCLPDVDGSQGYYPISLRTDWDTQR